jgi:tetratricopeptide (TPR) repeat protein
MRSSGTKPILSRVVLIGNRAGSGRTIVIPYCGIGPWGVPRKHLSFEHMRYSGLLILVVVFSQGCLFPGGDGPVSRSLSASRQLSFRGIAALEQGRKQEARTLLAKAVEACPGDPEARRHYAEALWSCGDRQEAQVQLEAAIKALGEDPTLRVRAARMYLESGRTELALQSAEQAIDLDPKLAGGWAARGAVMLAKGHPEQALADYHRALGYAPGDREVLSRIAELYHRGNHPDRELATLQSLANTYSPGEEPQQVLYRLGAALVALGRYEDGIENLSIAMTRGEPTVEMLCSLSEAELLAGNPARAESAAREALTMQPDHGPSRQILQRLEMARRPTDAPQR